ncbi:MAG: AAA family ATPase [Rhodocyclaceae bacterium]|nr:MAG: AAA family ATPase [Rhodocyclaceae bacterium]
MYQSFFGLSEFPFGITPDTEYLFNNASHQEAINTLLLAVDSGEGFVKVTGEVGTGKTLLCRRFLSSLDENTLTAYLPNPLLEPRTLLLAIAEELAIPLEKYDYQFHLLKYFNDALMKWNAEGKRVLVCIDEAQAMPLETLESLRLLSNMETEKQKLMQVVMFGQPELDEKLANPAVRQLRQRITFEYHLRGLDRNELEHYLAHRMRVAGHRGSASVFTRSAVKALHGVSHGTPRIVNILAHKSLLSAFGEGKEQVGLSNVIQAARDSKGIAHRFRWWG